MTLGQKIKLIYGLLTAGAAAMLLGAAGRDIHIALCVIGIAAVFAAVILDLCWDRCPHCDEPLGRSIFPRFCPHCGKEIDYNSK